MPRRLIILLLVPILISVSCQSKAVQPAQESASVSASALKKVTFTFIPDRQYQQVFLAGTFNGWSTDTTPMKLTGENYEVTLFLAKGDYQYKFVADGNWITDFRAEKFIEQIISFCPLGFLATQNKQWIESEPTASDRGRPAVVRLHRTAGVYSIRPLRARVGEEEL